MDLLGRQARHLPYLHSHQVFGGGVAVGAAATRAHGKLGSSNSDLPESESRTYSPDLLYCCELPEGRVYSFQVSSAYRSRNDIRTWHTVLYSE